MERYLKKQVLEDLQDKMVFIGGPRQVGKTTFALDLLTHEAHLQGHHSAYLNWDHVKTRKQLLSGEIPSNQPLIIFDEIHKYRNWRNLVKGFYDTHKSTSQFLVTGSAQLDYYRRSGDSLLGRYYYYRMHPISWGELLNSGSDKDIQHLLKFGGFPEPFLKGSERHLNRWHEARRTQIIKEDLASLEKVKELSQLDLLMDLLPAKVGSILSLNSLREDLSVAHETISRWILIFEKLYVCFLISPFLHEKIKTVKKEKKLYLWDWSQVDSSGARFENLVASQLLKFCHLKKDYEGEKFELFFLRDREQRELDFVIVKDKKIQFAVECKTGERELSKNIISFANRSNIPYFYQVHLGKKDVSHVEHRARILPFTTFCTDLQMP